MALPPRGDLRRPLYLAASSCRVLGVLALLSSTCMGVPFIRLLGRGGRGLFPSAVMLVMLGLYAGVGTAYLVFAHFIRRRRPWAVVAALSLTGVVALFVAVGVIGGLIGVIASGPGGGPPPITVAVLGIPLLILAALGQLIYHLSKSFAAIRLAPPDEARGFDVLPVAVQAAEPAAIGGERSPGSMLP